MAKRLTNLDLVNRVDGFPDPLTDPNAHSQFMKSVYTLVWEDGDGLVPIGYVTEEVISGLQDTAVEIRGEMVLDHQARTLKLFHQPPTEPERTALVAKLTAAWRKAEKFRLLRGWRNEPWPVYGRKGELLFSMERAAVGLFGCMRYGVHLTAFVRRTDEHSKYPFRIWVPERSHKKASFASMLDNTVAGGMMTGEEPFECIIREADEEASLPEAVVRGGAQLTGTIAYVYLTDERSGMGNLIYPEVQWIYDLELPDDGSVVPEPKDGEVEKFNLHTIEEIQEQLAVGMWKPNCAVIMLDFLVRHGVYTRENEPDWDAIFRKSHRIMPFPGPHKAYEAE
ncbi:hypothetical protein GQ53DRAFT_672043 [Thozetella sp. PMI_491]|nr:hypothetical protein GQ53DRAFT_672043 [Thozetella sp. PMI_491]